MNKGWEGWLLLLRLWIWECCWEGEGEGEKEDDVDAGESALFDSTCDCWRVSRVLLLEWMVCALDERDDSESAGEASAEAVIVVFAVD